MADTRDFKLKLQKFNEEHPTRTTPKTDRDHEPESRSKPKKDPVEIARLKMINSLNLEQDVMQAARVTKALKAMK
jgi:hypothetical protein